MAARPSGWCSCEDYEFRHQCHLKWGGRQQRLRCKHIAAVRDYIVDEAINQIAAAANPKACSSKAEAGRFAEAPQV